jgi:hypothetical protein
MSRDRIRSHAEETDCDWCGWPMYVGDPATFRFDLAFCSPACADRYREARELKHDDDACHGRGVPIP